MRGVSIRDVAKSLNLSVTTVSMAMNGTGNISDNTRRKVLEEAHRLKYIPSRVARKLKEGSKVIGVFTEKTYTDNMTMHFVSEKLRGACDKADEAEYDILLFFVDFADGAYDKIWNIIKEYGLSGAISLRPIQPLVQKKIYEYHIPHVAVNWVVDLLETTPLVATDMHKMLEAAVSHFHSRGRRKMAYVNWFSLPGFEKPLRSEVNLADKIMYKAFGDMRDKYADMELISVYADTYTTPEDVGKMFENVDCDSVFFHHYKHGFWYINHARQHGIKVPEDISVMIYDYQDYCDFFPPRLTGIQQPIYELGRTACENVIALIEGREKKAFNVFLDPVLIEGETT